MDNKFVYIVLSILTLGWLPIFDYISDYIEKRDQRKGWEFIKDLYIQNNHQVPQEVETALKDLNK